MKTFKNNLSIFGGFIILSFVIFYSSCSIPCEFGGDTIVGTWVSTDQNAKVVTFASDGLLEDEDLILTTVETNMSTMKSWALSTSNELIITEERVDGSMNFITYRNISFDCGFMVLEDSNGRVELNQ